MKSRILARLVPVFLLVFLSSCTDEQIGVIRIETQSVYTERVECEYILNIRSKKIHKITCGTAARIHDENRRYYEGTADTLIDEGYSFCGNCHK